MTCAISFTLVSSVCSDTFNDVKDRTQVYVIDKLGSLIQAEQILIAYKRTDELLYSAPDFTFSQATALGLNALRYCEQLKGLQPFTQDRFFAYMPYSVNRLRSSSMRQEVQYYYPCFPCADQHILIFCKKYPHIQQDRLMDDYIGVGKEFVVDAHSLPEAEFLKKYQLSSLFTNSVYATYMPGIFEVDHPVSAQGCVTHCSEDVTKRKIIDKSSRLIKLSRREVSEIVYIAYLIDGQDGIVKYAEEAKKSKILEPMTEAKFTSKIGLKLYEKMKVQIQVKHE